MNRRVLPLIIGSLLLPLLIIGSLLLPLGCGGNDEPTGPTGPSFSTLIVTTTSLPNAAETLPYTETLAAIGGDGSYTWSLTVGSLPAGLSLAPSTSDITGTPTGASSTFTVQVASGDGQTATQDLTITLDPYCSVQPASAVPTFEDASLESAIRGALGISAQDDLTCGLISGLTFLDASDVGVESLVGIQNLTSLVVLELHTRVPDRYGNSITDISALSGLTSLSHLSLYRNSITDISALSGLTSLTFLSLHTNSITDISALSGLTSLTLLALTFNSITDITPLSGLTSLTLLNLAFNSITDITPLSGLTGLTFLGLHDTSITDISALRGLTSLTFLALDNNSITDISALSGLTSLTYLNLQGNTSLSNIQPLLDNTGLGAGGEVYLRSTNVSCADVALLEAKGVTVQHSCS